MAAGRTRDLSLPASAVLAAALPILFLHVDYQPGFTVHAGSTSEHVVLSDLVLLAVGITALVAGIRHGFAPLRAGWPIWIGGGIFLADVFAGSVYPKLWASGYEASTHAVTAAKFAEYALLALAVPLLVRARRDAESVVGALLVWSVARDRGRGRADLRRRHPRGVDGRPAAAVVPRPPRLRVALGRGARDLPRRARAAAGVAAVDRRSSPSPASRAASG